MFVELSAVTFDQDEKSGSTEENKLEVWDCDLDLAFSDMPTAFSGDHYTWWLSWPKGCPTRFLLKLL